MMFIHSLNKAFFCHLEGTKIEQVKERLYSRKNVYYRPKVLLLSIAN